MKDIHLVTLEKYNDPSKYEPVAEGIYKALFDYENGLVKMGQYVTALSFTLETEIDTEDWQYPLEDVLDKYLAHVSEFIQYAQDNPVMQLELCTQGGLNNMKELVGMAGRHVFNREVTMDGKTYIELVIE